MGASVLAGALILVLIAQAVVRRRKKNENYFVELLREGSESP